MNYYQAQNLLDEVRAGANYSIQTITRALQLTGDLSEDGIERLNKTVNERTNHDLPNDDR